MKGSGKRVIGRRKPPKVGRLSDLFEELVSIPDLINHDNLVLESGFSLCRLSHLLTYP
jgi:hypothetical protein